MARQCVTERKLTFCVGDRVTRTLKNFTTKGTVVALEQGADNQDRPRQAARVRWDNDKRGDKPYQFLFSELRKVRT